LPQNLAFFFNKCTAKFYICSRDICCAQVIALTLLVDYQEGYLSGLWKTCGLCHLSPNVLVWNKRRKNETWGTG